MNKKNFTLGGALIILVALAYLYQGPIKEWRQDSGKPKNFLAIVDVEQIDKIEIIKNEEVTVLEKAGERWKIGGTKDFYVKDELVSSLKSGLDEAVEADIELVSGNKEKKSDFQTDLENGVNVKLSQGDQAIADFIVGKRAVDFTSTYISELESDNTYIITADISGVFNYIDWRDKTIFAFDKEKISKIRFQYPDREFTITKTLEHENTETAEYGWEGALPYKFSIDQKKIDVILDIMSNLTAVEIPGQNFEGTGLEKNLIIAQVYGEGIDNILMIGDANEDELYYAKKGDSDNIYLIVKEQRDELDKRIGDFK